MYQAPRLRLSEACLQPSLIENPRLLIDNQTYLPKPVHLAQNVVRGVVPPARQSEGTSRNQAYNEWQGFAPPPIMNNPTPIFNAHPPDLISSKSDLESLAGPIKPMGQYMPLPPSSMPPPQSSITESRPGQMMQSENQRYEEQLLRSKSQGRKIVKPGSQSAAGVGLRGGKKKRRVEPPAQVPLVTVGHACKFLGLVDYPVPLPSNLDNLPRFLSSLANFEAFYLPLLASVNPGRGILRLRTLAKAKWRELLIDNSAKRGKPKAAFFRKPKANRVRLNMVI